MCETIKRLIFADNGDRFLQEGILYPNNKFVVWRTWIQEQHKKSLGIDANGNEVFMYWHYEEWIPLFENMLFEQVR